MNHYINAKLVSWRKISVIIFTSIPRPNSIYASIYKNRVLYKKEKISRINSINHLYLFDLSCIWSEIGLTDRCSGNSQLGTIYGARSYGRLDNARVNSLLLGRSNDYRGDCDDN